ncbi:copper resistance CopC family protein [Promicromonospora sp. NPDC050249]|uniref:copper resistance CopC family protein n=1 Tax=Promicromonospora sp. NPDC050249 TaxID=3154743 RepID=UPI00340A8384
MPRSRPLVAGLAVAVVALCATAAPASAHDRLISSDPTSDQKLAEAPAEVSLTFSADVLDMGAAVVVSDAAGTEWVSAVPTVDGPTVTAVLDPGMPDAGYEIRWRVVSSDGHPITGVVPFTVGDGEPLADGAGGVEPGAAGPGAAEPGEASVPGTDAQSSTQTQIAQEDEGPWRVALVGASGAAVAVALLVLVQFLRRRSDVGGAEEPGDEPSSSESV